MDIGTQALLENYVSMYERQKKKCITYTDEEETGRAIISTINVIIKNLKKRENENE